MAKRRASVLRLNLRDAPSTVSGDITAVLPLAHDVETLGTDADGRFTEVDTVVDGDQQRGLVATRLLRPLENKAREALLGHAAAEWLRFEQSAAKEHHAP